MEYRLTATKSDIITTCDINDIRITYVNNNIYALTKNNKYK